MTSVRPNFLTANPRFDGSAFSLPDLVEARRVYSAVFDRYAPTWPNAPRGVLGMMWNQETRPAMERIIDIARMLYNLSRGITKESTSTFEQKIVQLLNCKNEPQFEELLAELRVGAMLAVRAGPVSYEPLARQAERNLAVRPTSPDFAIRLPGSDVLIEVTTLRIGALDNWERAIQAVQERIRSAAVSAGLAKEVEIHAPLRMRADALTKQRLDRLVSEMRASPDGATDIELGPVTVKIFWRQMVMVRLPPGSPLGSFPGDPFPTRDHFSAAFASGGATITAASASKVVPILGQNVENLFVKSIRNTLDGKRAQFTVEAPSLLVIQPGAWRIPADYVRHLIDKRIWPNPQYSWLTGIGVLQPRRTFNAGDPPTVLSVSWNPNSRKPRTAALIDLVENDVSFSCGARIDRPQPRLQNADCGTT